MLCLVKRRSTRVVGVQYLICSLTDTCMFSFDVSFDKTQRFISVRADSVYMCVEI